MRTVGGDAFAAKAEERSPSRRCDACLPRSLVFLLVYMFLQAYSYYGLSSVLALYFHQTLLFSQPNAEAFVHWFICATFVFSMIGGFVADKLLGKVRTVLVSLGLWLAGSALLLWATWPGLSTSLAVPLTGLAAAGIGKGLATPVNSALLGDESAVLAPDRRSAMFSRFYLCICGGSMLAKFFTPFIRSHTSLTNFSAFVMLGGVVLVALLFFATAGLGRTPPPPGPADGGAVVGFGAVLRVAGRALRSLCVRDGAPAEDVPLLGPVPRGALNSDPQGPDDREAAPVCGGGEPLSEAEQAYVRGSCLLRARGHEPDRAIVAARAVLNVLLMFLAMPLFWALFFQTYSTWVFQAAQMNRWVAGYLIPADMTQLLSPLLVILLIGLFNQVIYPLFERCGFPLTPLRRLAAGLLCSVSSFLLSGGIQLLVDGHPVLNPDTHPRGGLSVFLQLPQYALLSCGEVMVGITGLEFAYSQTPRSMKSVMSAFWYLCVGLGNVLVGGLSFAHFCGSGCMMFTYAGLLSVAALLFIVLARSYVYTDALFCVPCRTPVVAVLEQKVAAADAGQ